MPTTRRRTTAATKASATKPPATKVEGRQAARKQTAGKQATAAEPSRGIVLTGPPSLLRATVSVENAVDQRLAIRGLAVHRQGQAVVAGSAAAVVAPGATAQVPVSVRLDPSTPPGDHVAELEVAGLRREVVLRVEPDLALRVSPRRVLATEGEQVLTLTVSNEGNVAIPLAAVLRARTDDGGPDPGPDVVLTVTDPPVVEPGTTARVAATLLVPPDLDPTRRHTARLPIGTADLDVIILPRTASERPS
ncbi:hypothetical protein ABEG17_09990 [Pedococcus sp. KACC 23699]|uniref:DUF1573 domain-containing protein n=1 Tax=Pedococcus sp. KACC 23699 TaxID=3149228 RepID=A0AAU7JND6_9MICO